MTKAGPINRNDIREDDTYRLYFTCFPIRPTEPQLPCFLLSHVQDHPHWLLPGLASTPCSCPRPTRAEGAGLSSWLPVSCPSCRPNLLLLLVLLSSPTPASIRLAAVAPEREVGEASPIHPASHPHDVSLLYAFTPQKPLRFCSLVSSLTPLPLSLSARAGRQVTAEGCKNLLLAGVSAVLQGDAAAEPGDIGANFLLDGQDVGKNVRPSLLHRTAPHRAPQQTRLYLCDSSSSSSGSGRKAFLLLPTPLAVCMD